jgi:hypothetical protein
VWSLGEIGQFFSSGIFDRSIQTPAETREATKKAIQNISPPAFSYPNYYNFIADPKTAKIPQPKVTPTTPNVPSINVQLPSTGGGSVGFSGGNGIIFAVVGALILLISLK